MLTVDDYGRIRRALRDGKSVRAIARELHHSHHTIQKVRDQAEPHRYQRGQPYPQPVLGPYQTLIDQILSDDELAPRKQRHTMMQVYRRLVDEHDYPGGYDAVRRYIGRQRRAAQPTFMLLDHPPGERLECDFGHIHLDLPEGRTLVPVFVCTWGYSNAPYALALPTERVEAVLAGMVAAFEFYGCVPREVWWDNPKSIVNRIGKGRERAYHERYLALASCYCFEPCPCMPRSPREKPRAENRVKDLQRRWATPVPQVADLAELNQRLCDQCLAERSRRVNGQLQTIGERWAAEQAAAWPLPAHGFEPCVHQEAAVDPYQTVRFDNHRYSVPPTAVGRTATVKAFVDEVVVVVGGQEVARHPRCYRDGEQSLDPYHFLSQLHRHPGRLDKAHVFQHLRLPPAFERLRGALELRHGGSEGKRQYIRVLQLLRDHPLDRVQQVLEQHLAREGVLDAGAIRLEVERHVSLAAPAAAPAWPQVQVPLPDLSRFDQLLNQGGTTDA